MPGPTPKQNRRRSNMPALGDWVVLPSGRYDGPKPRKPSGLHAHASAVWDACWDDPAAHMWTESDRLMVVELVQLVERTDTDSDQPGWVSARVKELRQLLGLSKQGRQKYRWLLPTEVETTEPAPVEEEGESPWGHLRPVADG